MRAVAESFADRTDSVDAPGRRSDCRRPDTLHPRVAGVAGNVAAFAAIYRFDFDTAHRLLEWAAPYHEMMGPFAARLRGAATVGIAAQVSARHLRRRGELPAGLSRSAASVGPHSHAARLAGALLRPTAVRDRRIWLRRRAFWTTAIGSVPKAAELITWPPDM